MVKIFKGCTIQSTINNSGYYESDEQVDEINDFKEQVDARNWLRNDSTKQADQINDSKKQVDAISDYGKLVDDGSDPKSDPSRNPKISTHITNGNFTQKLLISWFFPKIIQIVIRPINPLVTDNMSVIQKILGLRQTVLRMVSVTDAVRSDARILRTPRKISCTSRDGSTPQDVNFAEANSRLYKHGE